MDINASQIEALTAQIALLKSENESLKQKNKQIQQQLSATLDGTGLCLWEQDVPTGDLCIYNQEWGSLLGYTREEYSANMQSWKNSLHPEDKDWVIKAFEDHVNGQEDVYQAVHRMIHKDGSTRWVSDRGRIVEYATDGTPLKILGTHIDITQEKRYQLDLARLAHRDPLTDLLNRTAAEKVYKDFQRSSKFDSGTLLFIDVDNFKSVNDRFGHRFGDLTLIEISQVLQHYSETLLPKSKTKIARIGGDEFVIITTISEYKLISVLAGSLVSHFKQTQTIDDKNIALGLSIGISCFTSKDLFVEVCEQADNAMYGIKQAGKHNYSFWQQPKSISQIIR
ncbi:diguanylate cyclase [Shewanella electrodiphila]|uniref:Diguanylate cyclase n=1 Tax=Shewanella electrodiphila TaxID=934143 RepID=A0ABT0KNT0_9GAMM|nr:diguanylate cyclase [Shewanella electrodiphila]MCL1045505.1 diguanylate cyclase [Shewanella electrodiphila]